jgi:hypothetical protein
VTEKDGSHFGSAGLAVRGSPLHAALVTEPRTTAERARTIAEGLVHWSVLDDRIGWRSEAYAVRTRAAVVLVDPLPLAEAALDALGHVVAICLTIQSHQRSSWRLRRRLGAPVYAPARSVGLAEAPDVRYRDGDRLPGGLRAVQAPGPAHASCVLLLDRPRGAGFVFLGDLLVRSRSGAFGFVPDEYMDDPNRARDSARRLLMLPFDGALPGHGAPLLSGAKPAIRAALSLDARRRAAA